MSTLLTHRSSRPMRIDAHLHFWRPSCGFDNKPVADHADYRRDFMPEDVRPALIESAIDGVILVQTTPQIEETAWMLDVARHHDWILGVTGWVDLDSAFCDIAALAAEQKIVGIRAQLRRIADPTYVSRPQVVRNLADALETGLGITMLAEYRHYHDVAEVIEKLPTGPITLNHLGMAFPDVPRGQWRNAMHRFAQRPATYLQLSGLPFLHGSQWRGHEAEGILDDALDIFGPQRLLFASDWPMMLRFADYGSWVLALQAFLHRRGVSDVDAAAIFGGNVQSANPRLCAGASRVTPAHPDRADVGAAELP